MKLQFTKVQGLLTVPLCEIICWLYEQKQSKLAEELLKRREEVLKNDEPNLWAYTAHLDWEDVLNNKTGKKEKKPKVKPADTLQA